MNSLGQQIKIVKCVIRFRRNTRLYWQAIVNLLLQCYIL